MTVRKGKALPADAAGERISAADAVRHGVAARGAESGVWEVTGDASQARC